MKKVLAIVLALSMLFCLAACKKEEPKKGCYVTISVAGEAVLKSDFVELVDYNKDGKYTLDEALKAAHAQYNEKKEEAYGSFSGDYGTALSKLWGDESGSFGYYLNNESAFNLDPEVKENDYIVAYVYADTTYWSDAFCFFDKNMADNNSELTLKYNTYDESWNIATKALEGATVLVDGKAVGTTNADGKITVSVSGTGKHVVTASKDGIIMVPPICVIEVK